MALFIASPRHAERDEDTTTQHLIAIHALDMRDIREARMTPAWHDQYATVEMPRVLRRYQFVRVSQLFRSSHSK